MKSLFTDEGLNDITVRLENLTDKSSAQWGKMDVAQMLKHCQGPLEVGLGITPLQTENIGFLKKLLFKAFKPTMYNDKPWKRNLPTVEQYIVVDSHEFVHEKEKLKNLIHNFSIEKDKTDWQPHPYFGTFTPDQWGQLQYKHLDHHLKQFGV